MVTGITGLASGYFATLMQLPPGPPIALTTDGVGTKILLARDAGRWEPVGVDCVANNVNDLICVGAVPLALLDYMATDRIDEAVLEAVARGLYLGAEEAGIAIPAARSPRSAPCWPARPAAAHARPGRHRDRRAAARPRAGGRVAGQPGDVILGLPSSGLHSNGYSLARQALFETGGLTLASEVPGTGQRLDDALLAPTRVYVRPRRRCGRRAWTPRPGAHLRRRPAQPGPAGRGRVLLTRRTAARAARLRPDRRGGRVPAAVMYATFNMGTGFCVVLSPAQAPAAIDALRDAGEQPVRIGVVTDRPGRTVSLPTVGLTGRGEVFEPAS